MHLGITPLIHPLQSAIGQRRSTFADIADMVLGWVEAARQRRHLGTLDDRMLSDIGMSRADVENETSRAFWDVSSRKR